MNAKRIQPFSITLLVVFFAFSFQYSYAQWSSGSGLIYYNGGKVGIGTSDPKDQLHLRGNLRLSVTDVSNNSDFAQIYFQKATVSATGYDDVWPDQHERAVFFRAQAYLDSYGAGGAGFQFWTTDKTSGGGKVLKRAMVIRRDGNVGIGTVNPGSYKLAVNGKIRAKEIKVETGWADFVFEEDYALRSLSEVEQYIKIHKHLPDIPSAAEVEENGVQLGDISAKLLQKIEELTLYVIEQNKKIEKQNETLEKQSEEIAYLKNENQKLHSANEKIQQTIFNLK